MTEREVIMNFIKRSQSEIIAEDEEKITFVIFDGNILNIYFDSQDNIELLFN